MGFELILPFLQPIAHLIQDPTVSEIMVNHAQRVFIERAGVLLPVDGITLDERNVIIAIKNIARLLGDDISEEVPILDARLPDGSRIAAVLPPCSVNGTTLTIRKFQSRQWTCAELVRVGTITPAHVALVQRALATHANVLISGGTGTGKTTLLNALAALIPETERVVVIEDTSELTLAHPNLVRFEARRAQQNIPAVTVRDLLKATLRHRPDRILVGEVRGGEAFDLLQALNTGHAGSLSTIHANSAEQALSRFATCVLQSGVDLPYTAIRRLIAEAVNMVIYLERRRGAREVVEVVRVEGYRPDDDTYALVPL
jgi:pilus assembly protein CpaF